MKRVSTHHDLNSKECPANTAAPWVADDDLTRTLRVWIQRENLHTRAHTQLHMAARQIVNAASLAVDGYLRFNRDVARVSEGDTPLPKFGSVLLFSAPLRWSRRSWKFRKISQTLHHRRRSRMSATFRHAKRVLLFQ